MFRWWFGVNALLECPSDGDLSFGSFVRRPSQRNRHRLRRRCSIATMVESYKRRRRRRAALPSSSLLPFVVLLLVVGALLTGIPSCNAQRAAVGGIGARIKKIVPGRRSEALHSQLVPDGESMIDNSSAHPTVMLLATMMVAFVISYLAAEMNGARERSRSVLSKIAGK